MEEKSALDNCFKSLSMHIVKKTKLAAMTTAMLHCSNRSPTTNMQLCIMLCGTACMHEATTWYGRVWSLFENGQVCKINGHCLLNHIVHYQ